jgi:hypothetical protein
MYRVGALIGIFAGFGADGYAQTGPSHVAGDVQLRVETKHNQTVFHIGELINLRLAYTLAAGSGKTYVISSSSYDRSGRLGIERYDVQPSNGWDDPLQPYFQSFSGFIGGGLFSTNKLTTAPVIVSRDLNEWVRFNMPGVYRVSVTSTRVQPADHALASAPLEVCSNEISLQIVAATREWQAEALHDALSILDKLAPGLPAVQAQQAVDRQQAVAILRYLGTPGAAIAMADRLNDDANKFQFLLGLAATPARDTALEHMHQRLHDPEFPVSDIFLQALSLIALPPDVASSRPDQRSRLEEQFEKELLQTVTTKRGKALAVSLYSLVNAAGMRSQQLSPDDRRDLTRHLAKMFDSLPLDDQAGLLGYRWQNLDKEIMLPLLPKLAERYSDYPDLREMHAYQANQVSAVALLHWYEMGPGQARSAIIAEIVRPKPRYGQEILGILEDKTLPEVEQQLAEHLLANAGSQEQIASLIFRYGSARIEPQVVSYLDPLLGKMACAIQEPLLAYMLRVDRSASASLLQRAMEARGPGFSACNHSLLVEVASLHDDPMLQDIAMTALNDRDPQVAENAATYLGKFGTSSTEAALWKRLTSWNGQWKGREAELRYIPGESMQGTYEAGLGTNLIDAIATGQEWLTTETDLERLLNLSVTADQRQRVKQMLDAWRHQPRTIEFIPVGGGQFHIAQYQATSLQAAIEKLMQFPRGSHFVWASNSTDESENSAFTELEKAVETNGITVTRTPSR